MYTSAHRVIIKNAHPSTHTHTHTCVHTQHTHCHLFQTKAILSGRAVLYCHLMSMCLNHHFCLCLNVQLKTFLLKITLMIFLTVENLLKVFITLIKNNRIILGKRLGVLPFKGLNIKHGLNHNCL